MKTAVEFDCNCGATTTVEFTPPPTFATKLHQFKCPGCHSTWEFRFKDRLGKIWATHRLVQGTDRLAEVLRKKKQHVEVHAPQKKSPLFVVPELARKA